MKREKIPFTLYEFLPGREITLKEIHQGRLAAGNFFAQEMLTCGSFHTCTHSLKRDKRNFLIKLLQRLQLQIELERFHCLEVQ